MCQRNNRQIVKILEQSKFIKRNLISVFGWIGIFYRKYKKYLGFLKLILD